MATTDLKLESAGSIPKPGPIGRLVRLGFGALCLYYVQGLYLISPTLTTEAGTIQPIIGNGILIGLFLISYVINIGFSRAWQKWPAFVSAALFMAVALYSNSQTGTFESLLLAQVIWVWEFYLFSYLGLAFILAAILASPGCEMRAFHSLYSRITGAVTHEHQCPIGPLAPIDRWEAGLKSK
jgi:hypothetical protein